MITCAALTDERKQNIIFSRFLDLSFELSELCDRQFAVLVVVEALDKVQCSLLGVIEFCTQDAHRLVETNEVAARLLITATNAYAHALRVVE